MRLSPSRRSLARALLAIALAGAADRALAQQLTIPVTPQRWSFQGLLGGFDLASAQRGLAVYQQACASCHGMGRLTYADLTGLGLTANQVHAFASAVLVPGGEDAAGNLVLRPAEPDDHFAEPYRNEAQARAANAGVLPGDLGRTAITSRHGADAIFGLLTGYADPPPTLTLGPGMAYNLHWPGDIIAMPNALPDGLVHYADATRATTPQMARDVTTFLAWAAEPHLVQRRQLGVKFVLFMLLLIGLVLAVRQRRVVV